MWNPTKGFRILNNHRCIDVDECSEGIDECHVDGLCRNNIGSYTCNCQEGYKGEDNYHCIIIPFCELKGTESIANSMICAPMWSVLKIKSVGQIKYHWLTRIIMVYWHPEALKW